MLINLKSTIEKIQNLEKEKIDNWSRSQENLKNKLDNYYKKIESFLDFIKIANFENLYKIFNKYEEYEEYLKLYSTLAMIYKFDYNKYKENNDFVWKSSKLNFGIKIKNGEFTLDRQETGLNYIDLNVNYNSEIINEFYLNPAIFENLLKEYDVFENRINDIIFSELKAKLDSTLWNDYDTLQVQKLKFFYDIFLKEARITFVPEFGEPEYKEKQSIYDFVLSDIKYCKLLDTIKL